MRIIGLDPGLRRTGWGVIELKGSSVTPIAHGVVTSTQSLAMAERLRELFSGITDILSEYDVDEAAVEETFVNANPNSTLKLGQARGVVLLAPALKGLRVGEYAPNKIKKAIVGVGHASKDQMISMVQRLLPRAQNLTADSADALAIALCHGHTLQTSQQVLQERRQSV